MLSSSARRADQTHAKLATPAETDCAARAVGESGRSPPPPRRPAAWLDPAVLVPIYILLMLGGYWFFHSGRATPPGNEMSRQRALFTVVNAGTLTGFEQGQNDVNTYRAGGKAVTLGLIVVGIVFSLTVGGMAVARIAGLALNDGALVAAAVGSVLAAGLIGAAAAPLRHLTLLASVFQAISAWGNSGLFLGRLPGLYDGWTHGLLLPLAALGGLGLPVLLEMGRRMRRGAMPVSQHARTAIAWSAGVYLVGSLLLLLGGWFANSSSPTPWAQLLASASAQAFNTRSAGFAFSMATYWPRTVQWIAMGLMIIGGAPGGTAGGLKVTTLAILCGGAARSLRGQPAGRAMGIALTWAGIYLAMISLSLLLLLCTEPQMQADRVLFLAVSAAGNVGLSHDPVTVSDAGLYVLAATMLTGRIAPWLVLWWMAEEENAECRMQNAE
jgi:trk system potassium uptake protein TrkH